MSTNTLTTCLSGVYAAKVFSTADPLRISRVQLLIPQIFGNIPVAVWAPPVAHGGLIPDVGTVVWCMFQGGDPSYPVYVPPTGPPTSPLPTGTNTYTDSSGDVWISQAGGPWKKATNVLYTSVYRVGAWVTNSSGAAYGFDAIEQDPYLRWTGTVTYTCPVAGIYRWDSEIVAGMNPSNYLTTYLNKSGVLYHQGSAQATPPTASGNVWASLHTYVRCAAHDTLQLYHVASASGNNGVAGLPNSWATIKYEGSS